MNKNVDPVTVAAGELEMAQMAAADAASQLFDACNGCVELLVYSRRRTSDGYEPELRNLFDAIRVWRAAGERLFAAQREMFQPRAPWQNDEGPGHFQGDDT